MRPMLGDSTDWTDCGCRQCGRRRNARKWKAMWRRVHRRRERRVWVLDVLNDLERNEDD